MESQSGKTGICFQCNRAVGIDVVPGTENISAGKHIPGKILQQADRPDGRLFFIPALQAEGQLKTIAAHLRIFALFFVKLGKTVCNIMPVRDAMTAFPDLHTVQWIVSTQGVWDNSTVIEPLLIRVKFLHSLCNGIKTSLVQFIFTVHVSFSFFN